MNYRRSSDNLVRFATGLLVAGLACAPAAAACMIQTPGTKCARPADGGLQNAQGARWLSVPPAPPPVEIGEILSEEYQVLMNAGYYGLPPVGPGWRYYRVENDVYRVENDTRRVLERVTSQANRAFR